MRTPNQLRNLYARMASKCGTLLRSSRAKQANPLKPRRCQLESLEAKVMLTGTPVDPDPFVAQEVAAAIGESGTVTVNQANAEQWHEVTFEREYLNPIVIMGPASRSGGQPMSIRVRDVTSDGFQWQMDEWSYLDGRHITETVSYIVVEAGTHTLDNGATLVAGTTTVDESFERVELDSFDATPVVLTQISTVEDPTAAVTRVRRVTAEGFEVRVQEEEASNNAHAAEVVGYIAIDVGIGATGDTNFDVANTTDSVTHRNKTIEFGQDFASAPVFLAAMQTTDGGDTATVRYRNLNDGSATIFVEEEQSRDRERGHTSEVVGYFALDAGLINAIDDSGDPPVDPPLDEPTVIEGVLYGTKGDDGNLDANAAGVNSVFGDYGDDVLIANDTAGAVPAWAGPRYGFDLPEGVSLADYANVLNGGHGNDTLQGSDLNDLLISRADGREPVIAQDYTGEDDPHNEIDPVTRTYYSDQPIEGDDILIGGGGADLFYFQTLINAKEDIILKHIRDDGSINWNGVAGENNNVHDHWVDRLGDELIADFNREEGDHILIEGHTTEVYQIEYVDSDGDGNADSTVLHVWSNQGNGGGAHNKDLLGTITVANALLTGEDFTVRKTNYGIVPTVAQLDEAITPYSSTPDDGVAPPIPQPVDDGEATAGVVFHAGGTLNFDGDEQGHVEVQHNQNLELDNGTVAFNFSVTETGNWQALFSKDAHGQETGGHLTAFMAGDKVKVRLQTPERDYWLYTPEGSIEAGVDYHVAITFGADGYRLYLDGVITDANLEMTAGISANQETLALGANIWGRGAEKPYFAREHLEGTLTDFTIYDSQLSAGQIADMAALSADVLDLAFAELAIA